jgi:hypothetical protein
LIRTDATGFHAELRVSLVTRSAIVDRVSAGPADSAKAAAQQTVAVVAQPFIFFEL